jgi:regulator of sirC expression with transglutaminase-like and TPR domain
MALPRARLLVYKRSKCYHWERKTFQEFGRYLPDDPDELVKDQRETFTKSKVLK